MQPAGSSRPRRVLRDLDLNGNLSALPAKRKRDDDDEDNDENGLPPSYQPRQPVISLLSSSPAAPAPTSAAAAPLSRALDLAAQLEQEATGVDALVLAGLPAAQRREVQAFLDAVAILGARARDVTQAIQPITAPAASVAQLAERLPVAADPHPPLSPPADATKAQQELLSVCTPTVAARSLVGLARGLPARGPAPAIAAATTNHLGCFLSSSRGQQNGGHCQMAPLFPRATTRAPNGVGAQRAKKIPQLVHRLAIRAWGTMVQQHRLIERQWDVSHRCHKPACFNPEHLEVELHADNMRRRNMCEPLRRCRCGLPNQCIF
jgi:hypothetical protein